MHEEANCDQLLNNHYSLKQVKKQHLNAFNMFVPHIKFYKSITLSLRESVS